MAKKTGSTPPADGKATSGTTAKNAPIKKKAGAKKKTASKKAAAKKEKKAKRATLATKVIGAVQQFHKETTLLSAYAHEFFSSLRKSRVTLPSESRKALNASARDLRKAARTLKKLARYKGK